MLQMVAVMITQLIMGLIIVYMTSFLKRQSYHISVHTGYVWVQELINGHPNQINTEFRNMSSICLYISFGPADYVTQNIFYLTSKSLCFYTHVWQDFQAVMLQNIFSSPTQSDYTEVYHTIVRYSLSQIYQIF